MAIPPNRGITTEEARGVLYSFDSSALSNAAWALRDLLMGAEDKSLVLWRETIGPWFAEAWPKRPMDKSQTLSGKLAFMAVDAGNAFPDIVSAVEELLIAEEHQHAVFHMQLTEEKTGLISRFRKHSLILANRLVADPSAVYGGTLKKLMESIATADPELRKADEFKRLVLPLE